MPLFRSLAMSAAMSSPYSMITGEMAKGKTVELVSASLGWAICPMRGHSFFEHLRA
jgi:hypothetical protein